MLLRVVEWSAALGITVLMLGGSSLMCTAQEGPAAWWQFDDGAGPIAADSSPNALDAQVVGAKWARGPFGGALWFDGTTSHVAAPSIPGLDSSDQMTISAWVYWEDGGRYPNIITGGQWSPGGFLIFVTDRTCQFRMGRPGHAASDPNAQWRETGANLVSGFELGRWYHLAAVFDRPTITTYLDGRPVGSATWDYPVGHCGDVTIGRWAGERAHAGLIDDVRIYTRALSAEEIAQVYEATAAGRLAAGGDVVPYQIVAQHEREVPIIASFATRDFTLQIDELGRAVSLTERSTGRELLAAAAPFAWVNAGGQTLSRVRCAREGDRLSFGFGGDRARVALRMEEHERYLAIEVVEAEGEIDPLCLAQLEVVPLPLRSSMSGVVADDEVGVCMRALTIDTHVWLGGSPLRITALAEAKHGLVGTRAALVACPAGQLRSALQEVARAEAVPRSDLGGPWAREAEQCRGSYLFADVSEANVDDWIALSKRGGFTHVHFSSWWQTLGHYEPRASLFPSGMAGLKECVRRVHEAGLQAGMHTLTGCIDTRDAWVTPAPDPRLAADATYTLARPMDEGSDAIYTLEPPGQHDTIWSYAGAGNVIRIGDELIHYAALSREQPYGFFKCTRGAFGTIPTAHPAGARADHLRQRYLAFYPDESTTLVGEVADRIARVFNECEFDQIYHDGAEGMGDWHAMEVMRTAIYERLKRPVIVEASAWGHWSWWFHSRVGAWDHSKWGFRVSTDAHMADLRTYREAALLQGQLGWWAVNGPGSAYRAIMPEEMEYFCAKVLANDAPMSLQGVGRIDNPANARMSEYLTMTGWYERLRLAGYFHERVLRRVREPGNDYHLRQTADGRWELAPRRYASHIITGLADGSGSWLVANPYPAQPAGVRITALFGVEPYDSERRLVIADADDLGAFTQVADAADVTHSFEVAPETTPAGEAALAFSATNSGEQRRGAWARVERVFQPHLNLAPCDALGVWVHGDGKGELLNIQLSCPPEYMRAYAFNLVPIDFEGWRYVELLLRERDPDTWAQHLWPYATASAHGVVRTALTREHVSELSIYLNNLPTQDTARVLIGPIVALPTGSIELRDARLSIGTQSLSLPVTLPSGSYLEVEPNGAWRLYDARCELLERGRLEGPAPELAEGLSPVAFSCTTATGRPGRAEVTLITEGQPLRETAPADRIDWSRLRYEYVMPALVTALDGAQNVCEVVVRPGERARLGAEITLKSAASSPAAYNDPSAVTLESFDDLSFFADSPDNQFARYVFDGEHEGISTKPGVTQQFEPSTDVVQVGAGSARYSATSTRDDNSGWSARGRRYAQPLDLSSYRAIGVWVHGDGKLEVIKFQLRDTAGGWHDMYRVVDFSGWRYLQFGLGGDSNLDRSQVEYLIVYYNAIPAGQTVTCYVDDIRALPGGEALHNPSLTIGNARVVFPVSLGTGDRIAWDGGATATVRRAAGGGSETVSVQGALPPLAAGATAVAFAAEGAGAHSRIEVALVKDYGAR
ncbi:MAG: LamG-like jellyroll fold domain-containing protein [Armatimonadota bacterium]